MNNTGEIYGASLFELASDEGKDQKLHLQLREICEILKAEPDYILLLDSPALKKDEKAKLLDETFAEKADIYLLNFLKILSEKRYVKHIFDAEKAYSKLYRKKYNIENVEVITATEMPEELSQKLEKKLEEMLGKKISATYKINSEIIGGLVVNFENSQIDYSLKSKLSKLEEFITSRKG